MSKRRLGIVLVFAGSCIVALLTFFYIGPPDVHVPWPPTVETSQWSKADFETLDKLDWFLRTTETRDCAEAQRKFTRLPQPRRVDAWGRVMQVNCIHGGWEIRSMGADGVLVTRDDLAVNTVELDLPRD